ncbi:hypothetical protein TNCV_3731121 [Trichonephila clavipes]|nr:hypothetical protein TNCV_3731121 [Trichonephila clavipes]
MHQFKITGCLCKRKVAAGLAYRTNQWRGRGRVLFEVYGSLRELPSVNLEYPKRRTATAGSDVVQSGRPIFDDFFQHLWPYIGNNTASVVFKMVKRLWLIRIDQ